MNLWLRLLLLMIRTLFSQRLKPLEESFLKFYVWPNDLDANLHMNNGRYLTIMDLGRLNLMARAGLLWPALKLGWRPVLGAANIRFRRPLHPFEAYLLRTRLIGWDDKWFYMEQIFELTDGTLAAKAIVRGLLREKGRSIPPSEMIQTLLGTSLSSPPLPSDLYFQV